MKAVEVQIIKLVIYTPKIWIYPCLTGFISLIEEAILPVPNPASFEKIPLWIPTTKEVKNPE